MGVGCTRCKYKIKLTHHHFEVFDTINVFHPPPLGQLRVYALSKLNCQNKNEKKFHFLTRSHYLLHIDVIVISLAGVKHEIPIDVQVLDKSDQ